ncbi:transglycosylase SLT domain-containing protein [uncultured Sunxiuqinia sp.]|uniref:transglycosylase SLT domain-containing protein n=1 Tax=uncultured Sunxiuqinia sp. TaxID=1573825 RepID=UPI002AA8A826|nr:transporter substrate-binding domain-containing protein [uncultured Sunxiuqinia sp.]
MILKTTFKFRYRLLLILSFLIVSCSQEQKNDKARSKSNPIEWDLKEIKETGKLRALTVYSSTTYFLYRGRPMGYEYELLERFVDYLDVSLELIVVKNVDELFEKLNAGEGDIVAHGLTITSLRKREVSFTDYLYLTKQVLVQKKPDNWRTMHWNTLENALIEDPMELLNDTVSIRRNSSYSERIVNLSEELGGQIYVDTLPGEMATDEIIKEVARGNIEYTIADQNIASIMASYYPILDIDVPVSFSQRISWATRHNSPNLLKATNEWLKELKKEVDYNVIYNKYFKNTRDFRRRVRSDFYSLNNQEISPYDDLIKTYSKELNWDWRLVTSLIYQESKFNPNNSSWADALGLMQLMPATAEELGVTDRTNPEQSIKGGITYLKQIRENFESLADSVQKIKFTMAAYNCGLYHVIDAQSLAVKRGLDPDVWDENVEDMILELSLPKNYNDPVVNYGYVRGIEPYNYVRQIFERYQHYTQFIDE